LSADEFWHLTFLEAWWLTQAYWQQQARRDRPLAWMIQILLNVHRGQHVSPIDVEQVMAALGHATPPPPPPATPEELHMTLATLAETFRGGANGQAGG
jgi:hypothetical protein